MIRKVFARTLSEMYLVDRKETPNRCEIQIFYPNME